MRIFGKANTTISFLPAIFIFFEMDFYHLCFSPMYVILRLEEGRGKPHLNGFGAIFYLDVLIIALIIQSTNTFL